MTRLLKTLTVACFVLAGVAQAQTQTHPQSQPQAIRVSVGQQHVLHTSKRIKRVALGDPDIATVNVINAHKALITGHKRGTTSLMLWHHGSDKATQYAIAVRPADLPPLMQKNKRMTLKTQVQTDIRIAEVSRKVVRRLGFNFLRGAKGKPAIGVTTPGSVQGIGSGGSGGSFGQGALSFASSTGFQSIGDAFNILVSDAHQSMVGLISILERRGLMHTLAEPSLVAMSGQTATFLAGGEFPIPVAQGGTNGSITIQFKEFGIRLSLTPTVLANDRIVLKVAPEVSELDYDDGVTVSGIKVPGIKVRRTDTTVRLGDGESFIISGLVDQKMAASVDKIPWLGDIPILGAFFRSTNFQRNDKELIMVVTPHLVTPLKKGTKVKLPGSEYDKYNPSSSDLFLFENGGFTPRDSSTGFSR